MLLSRRFRSLILFAALAGVGTAVSAAPPLARLEAAGQARGQDQRDVDRRAHDRRDDHRALSDAVRRAERATRGQVLSAERVQYDGRDVNRVKIVDDRGRVRVYWDDPEAQRRQDGPRTRRDDGDDPNL